MAKNTNSNPNPIVDIPGNAEAPQDGQRQFTFDSTMNFAAQQHQGNFRTYAAFENFILRTERNMSDQDKKRFQAQRILDGIQKIRAAHRELGQILTEIRG